MNPIRPSRFPGLGMGLAVLATFGMMVESSTPSSARTLTVSNNSAYKGIATQARKGDLIVLKPGSYNGELLDKYRGTDLRFDTNYSKEAWLPASNGEELLATIVPANDLRSPTDLNIDPEFVELGRDYRLSATSQVAAKMKADLPGAFPVAAVDERARTERPAAAGPVRDALSAVESQFVFEGAKPPFALQLFETGDWRTFHPGLGNGWWIERHHASRALTASEQDQFRTALRTIAERWPGLILRATAHRQVRIGAPASGAPTSEAVAQAFHFGNRLRLESRFFAASTESQLHTLVHELVHLGDAFTTVSSSADWIALCGPLLSAAHKEMRSRQLDWMHFQRSTLGETEETRPQSVKDVRSVIYAQNFPSWLAAKNPPNALRHSPRRRRSHWGRPAR